MWREEDEEEDQGTPKHLNRCQPRAPEGPREVRGFRMWELSDKIEKPLEINGGRKEIDVAKGKIFCF